MQGLACTRQCACARLCECVCARVHAGQCARARAMCMRVRVHANTCTHVRMHACVAQPVQARAPPSPPTHALIAGLLGARLVLVVRVHLGRGALLAARQLQVRRRAKHAARLLVVVLVVLPLRVKLLVLRTPLRQRHAGGRAQARLAPWLLLRAPASCAAAAAASAAAAAAVPAAAAAPLLRCLCRGAPTEAREARTSTAAADGGDAAAGAGAGATGGKGAGGPGARQRAGQAQEERLRHRGRYK